MARTTPPRFVIRTLVVTLATVAFVLSAVLLVVALQVRDRVRAGVIDKLATGQRLLAALEDKRGEELSYHYLTGGTAGIPCACRPGCKTVL